VSGRNQVEQLRAERFDVLRQIYEATDGDTTKHVQFYEVLRGYDRETLVKHIDYLSDRDLIDWIAQGFVQITHYGVEEYEEALLQPDRPTEHFPPVSVTNNIVNIGSVSGQSQVQVGTTSSTQTTGIPADALREVLAEARALVADLALEPDEEAEIDADLRTVEAQLDSPHPKRGIVREALSSVRAVLEGAAARGVAAGVERLPAVIEHLGHAVGQVT